MASFLFLIVSDEWIKLCTILETRAKDQEGWTTRGRFALGGLSRTRNQSQVEEIRPTGKVFDVILTGEHGR